MEAHSIEKFKSAVAKGIARSNLFHVELPRISNNNISSEDLNLFCSRVNLPSRQISTVDRVIGIVTEKVANTFITDDVNLTFHVTNDYNIKKYDSLGFINTPEVKMSFQQVEADFEAVFSALDSGKLDIIKVIKKYVPDFMHIETGKHLDQKM